MLGNRGHDIQSPISPISSLDSRVQPKGSALCRYAASLGIYRFRVHAGRITQLLDRQSHSIYPAISLKRVSHGTD